MEASRETVTKIITDVRDKSREDLLRENEYLREQLTNQNMDTQELADKIIELVRNNDDLREDKQRLVQELERLRTTL